MITKDVFSILPHLYYVYSFWVISFISKKKNLVTGKVSSSVLAHRKHSIVYAYVNYLNSIFFIRNGSYSSILNKIQLSLNCVITTPKKQIFVVLQKNNKSFICSSGMMRVILEFPSKSFKKKKLIYSNLFKFVSSYIFQNIKNRSLFIKIVRNFSIIPLFVKTLSQVLKRIFSLSYITYQPSISFYPINVKKRKALKKKLRKKKKYISY